jgi:hypothetical protein
VQIDQDNDDDEEELPKPKREKMKVNDDNHNQPAVILGDRTMTKLPSPVKRNTLRQMLHSEIKKEKETEAERNEPSPPSPIPDVIGDEDEQMPMENDVVHPPPFSMGDRTMTKLPSPVKRNTLRQMLHSEIKKEKETEAARNEPSPPSPDGCWPDEDEQMPMENDVVYPPPFSIPTLSLFCFLMGEFYKSIEASDIPLEGMLDVLFVDCLAKAALSEEDFVKTRGISFYNVHECDEVERSVRIHIQEHVSKDLTRTRGIFVQHIANHFISFGTFPSPPA